MKKFFLIAMMASVFTLCANAQQDGNRERPRMDRTEMIKQRTEEFAKQYGLDATQQEQLLKLNQEYPMALMFMGGRPGGMRGGNGMGPRRQGGHMGNGEVRQQPNDANGDNPQLRPRRDGNGGPGGRGRGPRMDRETMEKYDKELQKIMTPEQYAKFQDDRKARMERMRNMNRNNNNEN